MKKGWNRYISIICILTLCLSIFGSATALSGNTENIEENRETPNHDISVMSFNILDYDTHQTGYAAPTARFPLVVSTIQAYMPDIIGIQEAANPNKGNEGFDWNDNLAEALGELGYSYRQLSDERYYPSAGMTIGAGLMIFYKSDRFQLQDSGSEQYGSAPGVGVEGVYGDYSKIDKSRYFHYVHLYDKTEKTFLYVFNTHLSINPSNITDTSAQLKVGNHLRTQEIKQLCQRMNELADGMPCFATGDFNTRWAYSVSDDTTDHLFYGMSDAGFADGGQMALQQIQTTTDTVIDHNFFDPKFTTAITNRFIYNDYGSWQPSDHKAVITYFNYTPPVTFPSGTYDVEAQTMTDTSTQDTYTFSLGELPEYFSYGFFDHLGNKIASPLTTPITLTRKTNKFTLRFYSSSATGSNSTVYSQIDITIHCIADLVPELSAPGAINCYFAGNAYHILLSKEQSQITAALSEGSFLDGNGAESTGSFTSLTEGRTTYQIKSPQGEIFPLYIYKETAPALSRHLYIDRHIGSSGTVAYCDSNGVTYLTAGENGFSTLTAAAVVANRSNNYTLHVAPGTYSEGEVTFSKDVCLLGNNADISPLKITNDTWTLSENRQEETVLHNTALLFTKPDHSKVSVKGFTFTGTTSKAPIRGTASGADKVLALDIARNIIRPTTTDAVNGSALHFNNSVQKTGRIYENYISGGNNSAAVPCRILTCRNPNGLVLEHNYFYNFSQAEKQAFFITSEIQDKNTEPGYMNFTVQYCRFDTCNYLNHLFRNIYNGTSANVVYRYNDFVRCAYTSSFGPIFIHLEERGNIKNDYSQVYINIFGNRFISCRGGLYLHRNGNLLGDLQQATITVNQNRFINPNQYSLTDCIRLRLYLTPDKSLGHKVEHWSFSHNYFTSKALSSNDPLAFSNATMTNATGVSGNCIELDSLVAPYYTDAALTKLSCGYLKTQTGIRVTQNSYDYDAQPHSIVISAPEDAVISYSTDASSDRIYSGTNPTLTEPGELQVYYQVERPGYRIYTGNTILKVTMEERVLLMEDQTVDYDSTPQSLTAQYVPFPEDTVTYSYNGDTYSQMPTFTMPGSYTVTVCVTHPVFGKLENSATLTIRPLTQSNISVTGFDIPYDGEEHRITVVDDGASVTYSVDGGEFTEQIPVFRDVCQHTVTLRFTRVGYTTEERTVTARITPLDMLITGVQGYRGPVDGQSHTITLYGTLPSDQVTYSTDGIAYSAQVPTFAQAGQYPVYVKIQRAGHRDLHFMTLVELGDYATVFTLNCSQKQVEGRTVAAMEFAADVQRLALENIEVLSYGLVKADIAADILDDPTFVPTAQSTLGLTALPRDLTHYLSSTDGTAAAYITYTINGELYTQYSPIIIQ